MDAGRPGIYFVNAYDLPSRTYWMAASTTYHEAVPGHHFQLALEMELEGLPAFRTHGSWPQGTAYVEGWALYTERVADEAGLFRSRAERFGMLDSQAMRAVREGDAFDIRRFHDDVLGHGKLPLRILADVVLGS
jgi:uncharacterized protein (DUF885 family)